MGPSLKGASEARQVFPEENDGSGMGGPIPVQAGRYTHPLSEHSIWAHDGSLFFLVAPRSKGQRDCLEGLVFSALRFERGHKKNAYGIKLCLYLIEGLEVGIRETLFCLIPSKEPTMARAVRCVREGMDALLLSLS